MALQAGDMVTITITLSREYQVTDSVATLAKVAGVTVDALIATVEDGADWEPTESVLETISALPSADLMSEDWDWSEIDVY